MKKILLCALSLLSLLQMNFAATPTLSANAIQACYDGTTKPILTIVSGSGKTSYISGAINDPTNAAFAKGIYFTSTNNPTSFTITSDNTAVVPVANVSMTLISGDQYVCKIQPIGIGYATIKIIATNGSNSPTYTIKYAASAASAYASNTIFPTGIADASAAAVVDDNFMFVADDETNLLRLFSRKESGQSIYSLDITSSAGGIVGEEFDLEGASKSSVSYNSGNRIYWIASLGNSKSGNLKPYRDRVIATDISGTGASTTLTVKGYSTKMRTALISWGDANSWNFTTSASSGMIAKRIDGFNIEGLTVCNEGEKAFIGFRAPCVPLKGTAPTASNRLYAVIAPINNFETMMNVVGNSGTTPTIGEPILFDFGGLGIRSIERVGGNKYLILAGLFEGGGTPKVYLWDGTIPANPGTNPITTASSSLILLPLNLTDLVQPSSDGGVEGHPEAMLADQIGNNILTHLICDNGTVDYYNDATEAKALDNVENMKYRMDTYVYSLTGDPALLLTSGLNTQSINAGAAISSIIYTWGGAATGVTVTGLPTGVTATTNVPGKNISITGIPTVTGTFNYTVTTTQASGTAAVLTGTINISTPLAEPSGISASSTSSSITLNWTPVINANGYIINLCTSSTGGDNILFNETFATQTATSGTNSTTPITFDETWTKNTGMLTFMETGAVTLAGNARYSTSAINLTDVNTILEFDAKYMTGYTPTSGNVSAVCINDNGTATNNGLRFTVASDLTINFAKTGGTGTPIFLGPTTLTSTYQTFKVQINGFYVNTALNGSDIITFRTQSSGFIPITFKNVKVYVSGGGSSNICNEITVTGGNSNTYTITGLTPNKTYTYQLKTTNADPLQNSAYSVAQTIGTTTKVSSSVADNIQLFQMNEVLVIKGADVTNISICDITGKTLLRNKAAQSINMNGLNKGIYVVLIDTKNGTTFAEKIIKQ